MLDLAASERFGSTDDLADDLVEELAARATGNGAPVLVAAVEEIRRRIESGDPPVGLNLLAEVLVPMPMPPAPRQPIDEPAASVEVLRRYPCALLTSADPAAVARTLAAVLADGKRVLVTGPHADELAAVRAALPAPARALCVDGPALLPDPELRELRALLVTVTPGRSARLGQRLPEPDQLPDADQVAKLCQDAGRPGYPPRDATDLIPELLGDLQPDRLAGLVRAARRCDVAVSAMDVDGAARWAWPLLDGLLFGQHRPLFDRLLRLTADTVLAADELRDAGDQMAVVGTLPPDAIAQLRDYADYLDTGGRPRVYFRAPEQRAVEPVLRQLRLDGVPLKESTLLRQALAFVELIRAVEAIGSQCRRLRIPVPTDIPSVARLNRQLALVDNAARTTEDLRHEVLFIHPNSPVTMPDLPSTENVARAIMASGGAAELAAARDRLAELADELAAEVPEQAAAPEHLAAVRALRAMNLPEYLDALAALAGARRERADQQRMVELLDTLRAAAPELAAAWERSGGRTFAPGTVRFRPLAELLAELPAPDTADVVLLLGAGALGVEYLVVAAAAPRLLAVDAGLAGSASGSANKQTVATALRRAAVPILQAAQASRPAALAKEPAA